MKRILALALLVFGISTEVYGIYYGPNGKEYASRKEYRREQYRRKYHKPKYTKNTVATQQPTATRQKHNAYEVPPKKQTRQTKQKRMKVKNYDKKNRRDASSTKSTNRTYRSTHAAGRELRAGKTRYGTLRKMSTVA